jgi:hypothetical protein
VTGPNPFDPIEIVANMLSDPADMKALIRAIELCREIGNSASMSQFVKREVMPALEDFARDAVSAFWHQACTAKIDCDELSVVNGRLQVYGIDNLRIDHAAYHDRQHHGDLCNHWRARRPADPRDIRNLIRRLVPRSGGRSDTRFGRMHAVVRCCTALGSVQVTLTAGRVAPTPFEERKYEHG